MKNPGAGRRGENCTVKETPKKEEKLKKEIKKSQGRGKRDSRKKKIKFTQVDKDTSLKGSQSWMLVNKEIN